MTSPQRDQDSLSEDSPPLLVIHMGFPNATKNVKFKKTKTAHKIPQKELLDSTVEAPSSSFQIDGRIPDVRSPIYTKLVICGTLDDSVYILNSCALSGYLSMATVQYSDQAQETNGFISKDLYINSLLSPSISAWVSSHYVTWISCGYEHCLLLTSESVVMAWGKGYLGFGNTQSSEIPKTVPGLRSIIYLEAGAYHNACISADGVLYTWGRSDVDQLGLPSDVLTQDNVGYAALLPSPVPFFADKIVTGVACGEAHTLVIDSEGQVFSFGWAEEGQLGLMPNQIDNKNRSANVCQISALANLNVQKVCAGTAFSCCLDSLGNVFVWGNGHRGQLGLGNSVKYERLPTRVELPEPILDVVCGESHVICVSETGSAWAWGLGVAGRFERHPEYSQGSPLACYHPQKLNQLEITQRVIVPN